MVYDFIYFRPPQTLGIILAFLRHDSTLLPIAPSMSKLVSRLTFDLVCNTLNSRAVFGTMPHPFL